MRQLYVRGYNGTHGLTAKVVGLYRQRSRCEVVDYVSCSELFGDARVIDGNLQCK